MKDERAALRSGKRDGAAGAVPDACVAAADADAWQPQSAPRPQHGGRLRAAAARYGIAPDRWLDLSTGLNPQGWPVPAVPACVWQRLPEDEDGLAEFAAAHYGAPHALAVAGSQAAIQALPGLLCARPARVGLLAPAYAEHAHAWAAAGHLPVVIEAGAADAVTLRARIEAALDGLDALVLVHPNNPTGLRHARADLLDWRARLAARGGWLVVDEAFMDPTPADSLAAETARPGLVVLRSLGKFYGLAGARVGFVLAPAALLARLADALGPWTVAGPARWAAARALADRGWQARAGAQLHAQSARLARRLAAHGLAPACGCALFQWVPPMHGEAARIADALARQGVLVRLFEAGAGLPASLRFGLPGAEDDWRRLDAALAAARRPADAPEHA